MGRVLVVDDHPRVIQLLRLALEIEHEVIAAADGVEALEKVAEQKPDLVILDVVMPRMDGFQVLRQLKSDPATSAIPVIMLTVRDQPGEIAHGVSIGADCYLSKPFHPSDVAAMVNRFFQAGLAGDEPPAAA